MPVVYEIITAAADSRDPLTVNTHEVVPALTNLIRDAPVRSVESPVIAVGKSVVPPAGVAAVVAAVVLFASTHKSSPLRVAVTLPVSMEDALLAIAVDDE